MDEKNKSAVESFLEGTENEQNLFEPVSKDPFAKLDTQAKEEVEKEEEALPFHKDPKVQKFIEKELDKRLKDFKVEEKPNFIPQNNDDETTDVLIRLIGNDTPEKVAMVNEFRNVLERGTNRAKQEAIAELEARQQQEVQADIEAEQELETAFENIEENYGVDISSNNVTARKTRQEFVTFIERIAPKDKEGNVIDFPDMTSAWETFSELKKSTSTPSRAKELASRSMARSSEASPSQQQKRVDWNAVNEFMDTLKS